VSEDGATGGEGSDDDVGTARYVFRVTVRLDPEPGVDVDPATFDTVLSLPADPPGTEGWLFFRNTLWRGEVGDEAHARELAAATVNVPVTAVGFSELQTEEAYFEALKTAIADVLDLFNAENTSAVLSRYLNTADTTCRRYLPPWGVVTRS